MAACLVLGIPATMLAEEQPLAGRPPRTIDQALTLPIADFWQRYRRGALVVLGFASIYRFGDYFADSLVIAFLRLGVGFDFTEIAAVYKVLGFAGIVVGGLFGSAM